MIGCPVTIFTSCIAGLSVGVTGGAGVVTTAESGGAPAARWICSPMDHAGRSVMVRGGSVEEVTVILGCFFIQPTNCENRRSNSGRLRSQWRSTDSLDCASDWFTLLHQSNGACFDLCWFGGWISLVSGCYFASYRLLSKSLDVSLQFRHRCTGHCAVEW